jgi:hypothetical protein
MWKMIREKWLEYETKVVLVVAFVLVAAIAFQAGFLRGQKNAEGPIIIEKSVEAVSGVEAVNLDSSQAQNTAQGVSQETKVETTGEVEKSGCAFVGSKNSNKYHLPTCRYAKNINSENKVCFSSAQDATTKGYLPDKNCIK